MKTHTLVILQLEEVPIYTLNFTAKTYLFGPSTSQKVIKTVQTDQYSDTDDEISSRESRIIVVPDPTSRC